ncbi:MAG: imidazole glycerol phosphate synthase subunit HisH [Chitinophagaceae bacterium]|nr:imidazole glycerol phosphate synthase subunit HisH [Chitinophagaceae bacterium]MCW5926329.1 imidazole glycerol phosphate synthase subunit HisH [Chitinophagaceae bacterium]
MINIVDYGVGNLTSILNMIKKVGYRNVRISGDAGAIGDADKLILPGVGHFDFGMQQLRKSGLVDMLNKEVLENRKMILGICLGAQLLTRSSEEGKEKGLGWIEAETVRFDASRIGDKLKVPHMGWSNITVEKESRLFKDMFEEPRFYFVHSYHIVCDHSEDVIATARHGYRFTAGIERGNILGMQFHPEKSHKFGMKLLENFIHNY